MKTEKVMLVINEQHELLPSQREQLGYNFPESEVEKVLVPAEGWTIEEMERILSERLWGNFVVFVSPIPYLIKTVLFAAAESGDEIHNKTFYSITTVGKKGTRTAKLFRYEGGLADSMSQSISNPRVIPGFFLFSPYTPPDIGAP